MQCELENKLNLILARINIIMYKSELLICAERLDLMIRLLCSLKSIKLQNNISLPKHNEILIC